MLEIFTQAETIPFFDQSFSIILDALFKKIGINGFLLHALKIATIIIAIITICWLIDLIAKRIILATIERIVKHTKNTWDDVLVEKRVFKNVAHLVPAVALELLGGALFEGHTVWISITQKVAEVYVTFAVMFTFVAFLKALQFYLESRPFLKGKPLDSYMQLIRIIIYCIGGIYLVSVFAERSPIGILSALGAASVVLMLVFKDTILGFVGSIQIAANDMVKVGDWVEFPKYGADGDVIEIKLQTIKIQNWDKTITTIPTYSFVSDAFKNWRGMAESGGRRIKRAINIDMNSVGFCSDIELAKYKEIDLLKSYFQEKENELEQNNHNKNFVHSANVRKLTNLGTFRAYLQAYLNANEQITKEMTFLVRQLAPTDKGIPIEIYVFSSEQRWAFYEGIQADIFDHIIAVLPEFDLEVYQSPSGKDFRKY